MLAYDLFCGAGGATVGLKAAGFAVVGFDKWKPACDTHDANHPDYAVNRVDLLTVDWCDYQTPDLLWASPPCQPFSASGKGGGRADERDGMPGYLRAVEELLPPVTIMENVRGLTFEAHESYLYGYVLATLRRLGYDVRFAVLDAADYGVPQNRDRLFVIARRDGKPCSWPAPTHTEGGGLFTQPWVSMAEALPELAYAQVGFPRVDDLGDSEDGYRIRDWRDADRPAMALTEKARSMIVRLEERQANGAKRTLDQPAMTITSSADNGNFRWVAERPSPTMQGDRRVPQPGRQSGDPQMRGSLRLTVEQAARLQDFPEGYAFRGTKTAQFTQIGNAVPPTLARVLAEANRCAR